MTQDSRNSLQQPQKGKGRGQGAESVVVDLWEGHGPREEGHVG